MIVLGLAAASILAACGSGSGSTTASGTTIKITMKDIAFDPAAVQVHRGDTVKFEFKNAGAVVHEALIGDEAAQEDHAMAMSSGGSSDGSMPGMAPDSMSAHGAGAAMDMITVDPGKTGTLTYTFENAGTLIIGCHQPGHYEAGMKVMITVQ